MTTNREGKMQTVYYAILAISYYAAGSACVGLFLLHIYEVKPPTELPRAPRSHSAALSAPAQPVIHANPTKPERRSLRRGSRNVKGERAGKSPEGQVR